MQTEEQRLIDGLFSRLQQAEQGSAPRDATAESVINQHLVRQPAAPYYMAQTILIQEAALRQLNSKIADLEQQLAAQQSQKGASGGFLAGLFGAGRPEEARPAETRSGAPIPGTRQGYGYDAPQAAPSAAPAPAAAARAPGFMAGALQTAAGVAGGVMIGNMLTGLFHHSQPQEIVNIIEEPQPLNPDNAALDTQPQASDASWLSSDNSAGQDDDFSDDNDDFGGDDSSWF